MNKSVLLSFLVIIYFSFCTKSSQPPTGKGNQVKITTKPVSNIGPDSVTSGGTIEEDGGDTITERGVCWSSSSTPTYNDSKIISGSGIGEFITKLKGLLPNRQYYLRAYAINNSGTIYGNIVSFKTPAALATLSTVSISSITFSTATANSSVSSDGGSSITQRGVCWNTSSSPTISNNRTTNGSGLGSFSSSLSGLSQGTTYFVRAYATNSAGTAYGAQTSFTTTALQLATISTTAVSSISDNSASAGGSVLADGGSAVFQKGVCWSTTSNPTISNSYTNNGSGIGNFASSVTGLNANTLYYLRAYATNSAGTSYGSSISFLTLLSSPTLSSPANGAPARCCSITLQWTGVSGASQYEIQISKSSSFTGSTYILSTCGGSTNPQPSLLNIATSNVNSFCFNGGSSSNNGTWYWRIRAKNTTNISNWSATRYYNFTY